MTKNVATYYRTANVASEESMKRQVESVREYSRSKLGVEAIVEFSDVGVSGNTANRPGLRQLVEHCE